MIVFAKLNRMKMVVVSSKVIRSLIRPFWSLKSGAELRSMNRVRFIEWRKGRVLMASLVE